MITNRIHVSDTDGNESITSWMGFRDTLREAATPQPTGDGGIKVIENITVLSFDDDTRLTFVVNGTSFTILENRLGHVEVTTEDGSVNYRGFTLVPSDIQVHIWDGPKFWNTAHGRIEVSLPRAKTMIDNYLKGNN